MRFPVWVALVALLVAAIGLREYLPLPSSRTQKSTVAPVRPATRISTPPPRFQRMMRPASLQAIQEEPLAFDLAPSDPSRMPEYAAELRSPAAEERAHAAAELGRCGFAAADYLPILARLAADDSEETVRSSAREAILNIRGYVPPPRQF